MNDFRRPDYIGFWSKQPELIRSKNDFSLFGIWAGEKLCIDNFGRADIRDFETGKEISFLKEYEWEAVRRGAASEVIEYKGKLNIDNVFTGEWKIPGTDKQGIFALSNRVVPGMSFYHVLGNVMFADFFRILETRPEELAGIRKPFQEALRKINYEFSSKGL